MSKRIILYVLYIAVLFYSVDVLAQGSDLNQNFNRVELASVYDGDTFRVHLACKYGVFCKDYSYSCTRSGLPGNLRRFCRNKSTSQAS